MTALGWKQKPGQASVPLHQRDSGNKQSQSLHQSVQSSLQRAVKTTLKMTMTFIPSYPLPKCGRSFTLMEKGSLKAKDSSDEMNGTGIIGVLV